MSVRILVSRNKREGGYLGFYRCADEAKVTKRHHRLGSTGWLTLRGAKQKKDEA